MMKPTRYSHGMPNTPSHHISGTVSTAMASTNSPPMTTGSLRTRSSHTPAGSENNANGSTSAAVSRPICIGDACSSNAAVSGNANKVTWPPSELISTDSQRRRYSASHNTSSGANQSRRQPGTSRGLFLDTKSAPRWPCSTTGCLGFGAIVTNARSLRRAPSPCGGGRTRKRWLSCGSRR